MTEATTANTDARSDTEMQRGTGVGALVPPLSEGELPRSVNELGLERGMLFFDSRVPSVQSLIHSVLLDSMKVVHDHLTSHGLTYWLDGGGLLGSMRDGHLIDWDDDLDLGMERKMFERFREAAPTWDLPGLTFTTPTTDPLLPGFIPAAYRVDGTAAISQDVLAHPQSAPAHLGLGIDVFPFDEVPIGRIARWAFDRVRLEYWIAETGRLAGAIDEPPSGRIIRDRMHGRLVAALPRPVWQAVFRIFIHRARGSGRWGFGPEVPWPCFSLHPDAIWPLQEKELAGTPLSHPRDPDEYLRQHYGEGYLVPPAPEDRVTHSVIVGFLPDVLSRVGYRVAGQFHLKPGSP